MEELPPGEGQLVITGTSATSDGSGGNNCSVTIANQGDYMFGTGIYYMMYEQNSDYAEEVELAGWVEFDKGEAKTFNFHVPAGMLQAGNCEVFFEYTFW